MGSSFDRILLIRHVAICVAAATAYLLRSELQIGYTALTIVAVGAVLNFAAYFFRTQAGLVRLCMLGSPVVGVASWAALIAVTNGPASPFIAGLWLEVVLSAMTLRLAGIVRVTIASVAVLWAEWLWLGWEGVGASLALQIGFLSAMGGATFLVTRRWIRAQSRLSQKYVQMGSRLDTLERLFEEEQALSRLGENAAQLAHGLKNAVHSLRGFTSLIEPKLPERRGSTDALEGLRAAIDDLEALARLTLDGAKAKASPEGSAAMTRSPVSCAEEAVQEISLSQPGVDWAVASDGTSPTLPIPPGELREVLRTLLRNAAEAMEGRGKGLLEMHSSDAEFCLRVRDQGDGLSLEATSRLFEPGYTTKPGGSGYGLFLARRTLERNGGRLAARPSDSAGAVFELSLPVVGGAGTLPSVADRR